ncbi:hypothetical protein CR513_22029, partial [Mucuna pruriens]
MSNLLAKLISMKYKDKGNIREYIMEMSNFASKFKSLKLELGKDLLGVAYGANRQVMMKDSFLWVMVEVKLQLRKKIKVVKYDRDGEYCGRYDGSGEQCPKPFALFLKEYGIAPQYTMPGKPSMNRNVRFLDEVEFGKKEKIRNVDFEEEFVNDIDQVLVPIIVQETTPRRHEIPDDYIIFLQEHKDDISLTEDDPIDFCEAMQSSNSKKWIDSMKDEMKSMQENDIWDLVELPRGKANV